MFVSSYKVPVIIVGLQYILNFLADFRKKSQISDFIEICALGAEFFHADGRAEITNLIFAFRNFANPLKKHFWDTLS